MRKVLGRDFFDRPTLEVARDLLGKYLVRRVGGNPSAGLRARTNAYMITETEGYFGFEDKGSHAHRGKTARNTPMFASPGTIYVYFTYGMHWMLNLVCEREDFPAAVLIRGLASLEGGTRLNGPARLTKYLKIDRALNALPLGKKSGLWVEDRGAKVGPRDIRTTPRIGIPDRGVWTKKPWRFVLREHITPR